MNQRSAREVFEDHLEKAKKGLVEPDLSQNYAKDVRLFIAEGIFQGHEGAKELADRLERELPGAKFNYTVKLVENEVAFLEWTADSQDRIVRDGADSFLIRDGKIIAQTIHYTLEDKPDQTQRAALG